ncbi:hypothetical protein TpMuguga_01g00551 [Theileria parva strain Muguga]|uniref:Uncharacterized protein n=1 Tax=Theileria parva TaxID=5875 RepID=Q4N8C1_THEPA|nr:uncharacterized protein TpMuguga_01g00551 [Theileria parva strain Muguga]EAN33787.1 hypothetical protein TpMuguga_01g00551 [Theileria parva strain Muguga]|eukprot:XP_766070.1 hypothetical protein [Theileria parva strain Muguga]
MASEVKGDSACVFPGKHALLNLNMGVKHSGSVDCFERYKFIYDFSDDRRAVSKCVEFFTFPVNLFKVLLGDPSIREPDDINEPDDIKESAAKFLAYVTPEAETYVLAVPTNSNLILFRKLEIYSWERINTQVNLSKLEISNRYTHDYEEYFDFELEDYREPSQLGLDFSKPYYYDLEETNFKIVFNTFCHSISYEEKEIWERTRDNARHGYPNSLNFDLISGDVTVTFIDGTTEHLYSIRPTVKRSRDESETIYSTNVKAESNSEKVVKAESNNEKVVKAESNSEKVVKSEPLYSIRPSIKRPKSEVSSTNLVNLKLEPNNAKSEPSNENVEEKSVLPKVITLDINTIMSTNEYKTVCGPGFHYFKANDGFVFGKIVEGRRVIKKLDNPINRYEVYEGYPAYYDHFVNTERFQFLRPNKDNLKFYTNNKLLTPEDYKVKSTKYLYRIDFHKPLYRITYGDKVVWEFDYYEHEFLPTSLYFTHMNNMILLFPNGVHRDVKISVNLLKFYKQDEFGNKIQLEELDYEIMKPGDNKRFYTLRENIKCVEVWYDGYMVWQYDKEYPISICCDYTLDRVDIRFSSYVGSFVRFEGSSSFTQVHYFPNHLKLYAQDDKIVELSQDNYRIEVVNSTTVKYVIKPVKYDRMIFEKSLLWKQRNGAPIPRKIIHKLVNPTILLHHDTSQNQTKIRKFNRYNGTWDLNIFNPISHSYTLIT